MDIATVWLVIQYGRSGDVVCAIYDSKQLAETDCEGRGLMNHGIEQRIVRSKIYTTADLPAWYAAIKADDQRAL